MADRRMQLMMRHFAVLFTAACATALPSQHPLQPSEHLPSGRLPLIIWHGLGDTYDSDGMNSVGELLNSTLGPTYTYNVRLDDDAGGDRSSTFFGNITDHIDYVCNDLANEPILNASAGINAIGFSQGGLFVRGFIERCNFPPVKNLATFGSPHNGISQFQSCADSNLGPLICGAWEGLLETQTWSSFVQSHLVPAQYYRDPNDLDQYLESSNWLADINNERSVKNETYKKNLAGLQHFWMYQFSEDTTVVPKESEWFDEGIEDENGKRKVVKLRDRDLYKEDWVGLKELDGKGALEFKVAEGKHMQISDEELLEVFIMMYGDDLTQEMVQEMEL